MGLVTKITLIRCTLIELNSLLKETGQNIDIVLQNVDSVWIWLR